jgi:hypothetical protein
VSTWNAGSRAASLVSKLKRRASAYKTRHLLVTFGDDFKFKNAALQFQNMDLIIKNINSNQGLGVHIRYSTLSEYFQAVHSDAHRKNVAFPFHRGDFFPYADNGDSYWTGYYSTRPNLKVSFAGIWRTRSNETRHPLPHIHPSIHPSINALR